MDGRSRSPRATLVSHCMLLETADGLVLVDTGYGMKDVASPRSRLSTTMLRLMKPDLREDKTAIRQIQALGFSAHDVRHIVLSHLDFDHAGGLDDFPQATVHMLRDEMLSATEQRTLLDRQRYRPAQWGSRDRWRVYEVDQGSDWLGFRRARELAGIGPDVVMVPLVGHTLGHAGVAVRTDNGWLLYAADAYFFHGEMSLTRPWCTPGLRFYQTMMEKDRAARLANQDRLRGLVRDHATDVTVFCGHDAKEFETLAGRAADAPIPHRRNDASLDELLHPQDRTLSPQEKVDQNVLDSFPASDPPAWSPSTAGTPRER